MAERLTKHNRTGWILKLDEPQNEFEARQQLMSKFKLACEKLGKLEDILEKYGVESFELLEHIIKKGMVINSVIEDFAKEEYDKMKQDRDAWQKACELACDTLKQVMGKPLWIGGNIPTPEVKDSEYFYQQAKKEGEQE